MRINVKKIVFIYCIILSIIAFASLKIFFFGYQGGAIDVMTAQGILILLPIIILSLIVIIIGLSYFLTRVAKNADADYVDGLTKFTNGFQVASKLYAEAIVGLHNKKGLENVIKKINKNQGEEIIILTEIKQNEQSEQEEE